MGAPSHDAETPEVAPTILAVAGDSPTKAVTMLRDAGVRLSRQVIRDCRE